MQFSVVTYGTEGDTRPLVGLCRGLLDRGHSVRLFADRSTLSTAQALNIPATPLAGDIKATVSPGGELAKLMQNASDVTRMSKAVAKIANENTSSWMKDIVEKTYSADAVLFSGISSYVGLSVAEYLRIPAIGLGLWPLSPTSAFPSPLLPPWKMPGWLNRISHHAINALLWQLFRKGINTARHQLGQAPRKQMWQNYPILFGISRHLVPQPADWPDIWKICGAWSVESGSWEAPIPLAEFLLAGEPPIYVGFGSMGGFDKNKLLATVIKAIDGRRALFSPGWSGISPASLPDNFFVIGSIPHNWLFPKTSMVIHHGGAGTTHTASRAGVPSIVIPFTGDQFFWAKRLSLAGVAPDYMPHNKIDLHNLSRMITFAERPDTIQYAKTLGQAMETENGVSYAVEHIEKLLADSK